MQLNVGTDEMSVALSRYKPAIDGLRAIAIILVMLFHARASWFSGGYVGVDVFFVISGYLITSLIVGEYRRGNFSIANFYARRARRILPALFLVILATTAIGTRLLLPVQLSQLGSSVVATTLFVSNLHFAKVQNYFLDYTEVRPLLHTWSLAVEEQFYIFFPVAVLVILHLFKRRLNQFFLGGALLSFIVSVYLTRAHPQAAFYFSVGRAWELLLGAWIAVTFMVDVTPPKARPLLQWVGLLMIFTATFAYDSFTPFPGFAALLPAVGGALFIAWSDENTGLVRVLSHPTLVWLGLISYPLYLWHWPILVLSQQVLLRELKGQEIAALYAFALVLSAATWRFVELPIRLRKIRFSTKQTLATCAGFGCALVALGLAIWGTNGLQARLPADVVRTLSASSDFDSQRYACHNWDRSDLAGSSNCIIGATEKAAFNFAFWGDSIAGSMASAVDFAARSTGVKGLQLTTAACPPLLETDVVLRHRLTDCRERNEAAFRLLKKHGIRHVIMGAEWEWYADGEGIGFGTSWPVALRANGSTRQDQKGPLALQEALKSTIERLRAENIDVTVLGPIPIIGWNVPEVIATLEWRGVRPPDGLTLDEFMNQQRTIFPIMKVLEQEGVRVVYPGAYLCASICFLRLDDEILYKDGEHLTTRGAALLQPLFVRLFSKLVEPS
jgi:peptidoglycan/LPS O-acetylase OafA/YrhL